MTGLHILTYILSCVSYLLSGATRFQSWPLNAVLITCKLNIQFSDKNAKLLYQLKKLGSGSNQLGPVKYISPESRERFKSPKRRFN